MDGNHRDNVESKLTATENTKWVLNKKNKLWIPKYKRQTGFEDKTRWDWLQLIIQAIGVIVIPISIVIGVWQFTTQQQNDLMRSTDEQQQTTLQNYLGTMSDLLLKENLRGSKPEDVVRQVAEAQTLAALQNLNAARKGILVKFLYESHLIGYYDFTNKSLQRPIIVLTSANLSGADLSGTSPFNNTTLSGADLSGADLSGADLSYAILYKTDLSYADLSYADLYEADLSGTFLPYATLSSAFLYTANLSYAFLYTANLSGANLDGANLSGANLGDANLSSAVVTEEQLEKAKSLKGATMPDGSIHP